MGIPLIPEVHYYGFLSIMSLIIAGWVIIALTFTLIKPLRGMLDEDKGGRKPLGLLA